MRMHRNGTSPNVQNQAEWRKSLNLLRLSEVFQTSHLDRLCKVKATITYSAEYIMPLSRAVFLERRIHQLKHKQQFTNRTTFHHKLHDSSMTHDQPHTSDMETEVKSVTVSPLATATSIA